MKYLNKKSLAFLLFCFLGFVFYGYYFYPANKVEDINQDHLIKLNNPLTHSSEVLSWTLHDHYLLLSKNQDLGQFKNFNGFAENFIEKTFCRDLNDKEYKKLIKAVNNNNINNEISYFIYYNLISCATLPDPIKKDWLNVFLNNNDVNNIKLITLYKESLNEGFYSNSDWEHSQPYKDFLNKINSEYSKKDYQKFTIEFISLFKKYNENLLTDQSHNYIFKEWYEGLSNLNTPNIFQEIINYLNTNKNYKSVALINYYSNTYNSMYLPKNIQTAWMKMGINLSGKYKPYYEKQYSLINKNHYTPAYINDVLLHSKKYESNDIENLNINDLISLTIEYMEEYKNFFPELLYEQINHGWGLFTGRGYGYINEELAVMLLEDALKKATVLNNEYLISFARVNLGVVLANSHDKSVRNRQLSDFHNTEGLRNWIKFCQDAQEDKLNLIKCYENFGHTGVGYLVSNYLNYDFYQVNFNDEFSTYLEDFKEIYFLKNNEQKPFHDLKKPLLKNKKDFQTYKEYLNEEFNKNFNFKILELQCHFIEDFFDYFSINEAKDCWRRLMKEVGSKLSSYSKEDYVLYEGIKTRYNRLELLSLNQIDNTSYKDVYNFFHQQHQFEKDLNDPNIEENSGKFALLIGNSEYTGNKLQSPINDINVIESKLVEMDFQVLKYDNLNHDEFHNALNEFALISKNASITMFFFSGHGFQKSGLNYLVPIDIEMKDTLDKSKVLYRAIEVNDLIRKNLTGKNKLIFLDACRENPFNNDGLAPISIGSNTLISFSSESGGYAFDGEISPYTKALSEYIQDDKDILISLRNVRKKVKEYTNNRQKTWDYSNLEQEELILNQI